MAIDILITSPNKKGFNPIFNNEFINRNSPLIILNHKANCINPNPKITIKPVTDNKIKFAIGVVLSLNFSLMYAIK